jgi:DNA-binding MarR family transcriptional regulator
VLVEITDDGKALADRFLPGVRRVERAVIADLSARERSTLMAILEKVLDAAARVSAAEPMPFEGRRNRPARLA